MLCAAPLRGYNTGKARPAPGRKGLLLMIRSLAQVGVTCVDFQRSLNFYSGLLGLPILEVIEVPDDQVLDIYGIDPAKHKVTLALLRTGNGGFIELFKFEPLHEGHQRVVWERSGITHFSLNVKNLPNVMKRLEAAGVKFVTPVKNNLGTDFVFLRDPDGNLVELLDMHGLYWPAQVLGGLIAKMNMKKKYGRLVTTKKA
jgi:catechol 2,3-dioxygenase-like lactoylglutathione lyase family enzyme